MKLGLFVFFVLACQDNPTLPTIKNISPDFQHHGEQITVEISGDNFNPVIERQLDGKLEFRVHNTFEVQFTRDEDDNIVTFSLEALIKEGNHTLTGTTPATAPLGMYKVIVIGPSGVASKPFNKRFHILPPPTSTDVDTDTESQEDSDDEPQVATDTIWDIRNYCDSTLAATVRDFSYRHPDFDETHCCGLVEGLVQETLGPDRKPRFAMSGPLDDPDYVSITSEETFDQWYNTINNINYEFDTQIKLTPIDDNLWEYRNNDYFPVGMREGWGNQYRTHNFHFTTELHMQFLYEEGQVFTFSGDDDLWVFINDTLALDLGGVHDNTKGTIDIQAFAEMLGMIPGETYPMDIFHAERHPEQSNFHITTNIECIYPIIMVK